MLSRNVRTHASVPARGVRFLSTEVEPLFLPRMSPRNGADCSRRRIACTCGRIVCGDSVHLAASPTRRPRRHHDSCAPPRRACDTPHPPRRRVGRRGSAWRYHRENERRGRARPCGRRFRHRGHARIHVALIHSQGFALMFFLCAPHSLTVDAHGYHALRRKRVGHDEVSCGLLAKVASGVRMRAPFRVRP